ncbi:MAG: sulfatase [Planctomycetes bacterium]|nr:sulfatase [Planctomycetota bacterium]
MTAAPGPTGGPAPRIFRTVALSLATLHVLFWLASVVSFVVFQGSQENEFSDLARSDYIGFLALLELKMLAGYLLVAALHAVAVHPPIAILARRRGWGRWRIALASVLLSVAATVAVALGVATIKPYLLAGPFAKFWWKIYGGTPEFLRGVVWTPAFFWILLGLYALFLARYYAPRAWAWSGRHPRLARAAVVGGFPLVLGALLLSALPARARPKHPQPEEKRWNVLVLAADSLRGDRIGANGYSRPTSPTIDRVAAEGATFRLCLTPIASTLEGWLSLLTGQYPMHHGMRHMFPSREEADHAAANPVLLTRILREQGYRTAVVSDWAGNNFRLVDYGFEDVRVRHVQNFKVFLTEAVMLCHPFLSIYYQNETGQAIFPELEILSTNRTPDQVTRQLKDSIDAAAEDGRPFFLVGFYSTTHLPYSAKYPYYELFSDPNYRGPNRSQLEFDIDEFITGGFAKDLPPHEIQHIGDLYDGTVRQFDDAVAEVLEHLQERGLAKNTIVVITSDHGDDLYEPGTTLGHGISFNGGDQTNHIPLVISAPGGPFRGVRVDRLVRAIDLAPTLLELLGLPVPAPMDGVSLVPFIEDPAGADLGLVFYGETSYLFFRHEIPGEKRLSWKTLDKTTFVDPSFDHNIVLHPDARELMLATKELSIRTAEWKLVHARGEEHDIDRLYHLPDDPHCEQDLAAERPEVLAWMKEWLLRWAKDEGETRADGSVAKR